LQRNFCSTTTFHPMAISRISIFFLFFLFLFLGCRSTNNDPSKKTTVHKAVSVAGILLQPQTLENKILATGSLIANEEVELRSEIPGRVIAINFEEGSHVKKGDLLLKIDDRELQAQLKKLLVEDKQAKDDVYRKEKLLELKAVSQEEYDKTLNLAGIIQAQLELIMAQISKTEIFAPFSGQIGLRQISPGGYISPATMVARLQQTDPIKIDFAIPEKYQEKIRNGTPIQFRVEGIDSNFSGKVYAIEPKIDPLTRNVSIRAICPNPREFLIPGAFARVKILLEYIPEALIIPSEAIIPQMNGEKVFICRYGKAKSRNIITGIRTERDVQVLSGLSLGDTVITSGIMQLREEMPLKIKFQ
jgi:membrane fusion protein, multidrug efflux system